MRPTSPYLYMPEQVTLRTRGEDGVVRSVPDVAAGHERRATFRGDR